MEGLGGSPRPNRSRHRRLAPVVSVEAVLLLDEFARFDGVILGVVDADMLGRAIHAELGHPSVSAANNTDVTRRIVSPRRAVPLVSAAGRKAQIAPSVVEFVAVDMIEFRRIHPGHYFPDHLMRVRVN